MSNNTNKLTHIIPLFNSGLKQKISLNPDYKDSNHSPSYIINNFEDYLEDKQRLRLKGVGRGLKGLQEYNKILVDYHKTNTSLDFINELNKLSKESQITKISELDSINENKENKNTNNYIDNKLISNINFPLNLLINNNSTYNFKLRNYIKLISKFYPDLAASKNNIFKFNLNNTKFIRNIYTLLHSAFISMHCLISQPRLSVINDKIFIQLFFYPDIKLSKVINKILKSFRDNNTNRKIIFNNKYRNRKNLINNNRKVNKLFNMANYKSPFLIIYKNKLNILCQLLSKIFNKPVQLELIKLHYPFYDSNIIVNLLANFTKFSKIRNLFIKIFNNALIKRPTANIQRKRFSLLPGYLTGITIKFAGRFPTQKIVPRKTVKIKDIGSLARKKAILVENARFSNKNRRGSFSISVSTGLHLGNFIK
jgi:hypothetical protein|uniref:Small ribosomal subunit protein uS3m n=1 Tax=Paxillus involutus TaxID=71150 RepID=A0A5Q0N2G5_PAXIN|nr:ribosomal protein S3 [Paxillus involutus]QFZ98766.1 ribosomal protein S3 [Paxillus involutus]